MNYCARRHSYGFSLLELSLVIAIIAVIFGGALTAMMAYSDKSQEELTRARMAAIEDALLAYRRSFNRLPCPSDITSAITASAYGREATEPDDCYSTGTLKANFQAATNAVAGGVPVKTLGLADEYGYDGWGGRFQYSVDKRFTAVDAFSTNDISTMGVFNVKGGNNAFFGSPSDAVVVSGTSANFIGTDSSTQGDWKGRYGNDGYELFAHTAAIPSYATTNYYNYSLWTWADPTSELRALLKSGAATDRIASCMYQTGTFTIAVDINDSNSHNISFYLLDWDYGGTRSQKMEVYDANTNALLDSQTATGYNNGIYYTWNISGNVRFEITNLSPPNGVIGGIFFDNGTISVNTNAVYVLQSFGQNRHGAYPRAGGTARISAGSVNVMELENCDCTNTAASGTFDTLFYSAGATKSASNILNSFDDIVDFKQRKDLAGWDESK